MSRRRWLLIGLCLLLLSGAAYHAWAVNANPVPGSVWTYLGPTFGADWAPAPPTSAATQNVKSCGAIGNGVADDSAAIQACIGLLGSGGGTLFFPAGTYCIKTGPLVVTARGVTLLGTNREASVLHACGADVSIVTMSGYHDEIVNLGVIGSWLPATTKNTVTLQGGGSCGECTVHNSKVEGGYYGIYADAYEVYISWTRVDFTHGPATTYLTNTGGYIFRSKFDQFYPAGNPSFGIAPPTNWIASHAYAARDLAKVTVGGRIYILQAMNGGTSGTVAPAVPAYWSNGTVDGGITWQLSSPYPYYGVQFDTNSGFDAFLSYSDFSANFSNAVVITNTHGGAPPKNIYLDHLTVGSVLESLIYVEAGYGFSVTDSHLGNCLTAACSMISLAASFQGDMVITGNWIGGTGSGGPLNGGTGVFLGGGYRTVVSNNIFTTEQTAVSVAANVSDFVINNNEFASAVYGCSTVGINIAPGTSNYYTIMGNNMSCVPNPLQDYGTGDNKQIVNVATPTTLMALPTSCSGKPSSAIWNDAGTVKVCP